jgi:hypothetical protein
MHGTAETWKQLGKYLMSLDQIAADPMVATSLDVADRATLITRCASVLAALSGSLLNAGDQRKAPAGAEALAGEKLMTVREVAQVLGFTPGYVYPSTRSSRISHRHSTHCTPACANEAPVA